MISKEQRGNLEYDTVAGGRYHFQNINIRKMASGIRTKRGREQLLPGLGMEMEQTSLMSIAPSMNINMYCPSDPCHSEYAGISKLAHTLFVEDILCESGREKFHSVLRTFQFPPG